MPLMRREYEDSYVLWLVGVNHHAEEEVRLVVREACCHDPRYKQYYLIFDAVFFSRAWFWDAKSVRAGSSPAACLVIEVIQLPHRAQVFYYTSTPNVYSSSIVIHAFGVSTPPGFCLVQWHSFQWRWGTECSRGLYSQSSNFQVVVGAVRVGHSERYWSFCSEASLSGLPKQLSCQKKKKTEMFPALLVYCFRWISR